MGTGFTILGLIGYPLGHSFSAGYFAEKFNREGISGYKYLNFPIENIDDLPGLIRENTDLAGLNVTIPYKQAVIPYLHDIDDDARAIGAVNVIRISRTEGIIRLKGFNTDLIGVRDCLDQWSLPPGIKALIFGTGGSSKAVCRELEIRKIDYLLVSRKPEPARIGYNDVTGEILKDRKLLINCTPLGMHPATGGKPDIPYQYVTGSHFMFDLIYNPEKTLFMEEGLSRGASVQGGLRMLHTQAEASWQIWHDR